MIIVKKFLGKKSSILYILILAFILRLLLFTGILLKNPNGIYVYDSYGYWQIAYNIVEHSIFSQSYSFPLEPDYYRTPLYPLLIVFAEGIGPEGFSIIGLQIVLSVLTCYFTYRLAFEITQHKGIGNVAALLVALDIPSVALANLVLTETLFTLVLILSFYFFIRYFKTNENLHLIYAGMFSSLTILCRPIAFFIPFLLAAFILFKNRKNTSLLIRHLLLFLVCAGIVISPWMIRNKLVYNHCFLSVIREHNVLNYKAAAVYAKRFNYPLPKAQSILRWKTFREFSGDAYKQPYEYAKHIEREGLKIICDYPGIFIAQHLKGVALFFLKPTRAFIDIQLGHWGKDYNSIPKDYPIFNYLFEHTSKLTIALVFFQLFFLLLVYATSVVGLISLKENMVYVMLLSLCILIFANLNLSQITEARFRVPVWPLIAIISACGVYSIYNKWKVKRKTANQA